MSSQWDNCRGMSVRQTCINLVFSGTYACIKTKCSVKLPVSIYFSTKIFAFPFSTKIENGNANLFFTNCLLVLQLTIWGKSFQMLPVPQISSVGFKFYFLSSMIIFTEYLFCKFCDLIFLLSILWFVFHSMKLYGRNLFRKAASHTNRNRNVIFPYISWYFVSMSFIKNTFSKFWIFAPFKWDDFFAFILKWNNMIKHSSKFRWSYKSLPDHF